MAGELNALAMNPAASFAGDAKSLVLQNVECGGTEEVPR